MDSRFFGTVIFWLAALIPFAGIFFVHMLYNDATFFFYSLLIYALIYRPLLHMARLLSLNVIEKKDAWKLYIPFYHNRYFRVMWLGVKSISE